MAVADMAAVLAAHQLHAHLAVLLAQVAKICSPQVEMYSGAEGKPSDLNFMHFYQITVVRKKLLSNKTIGDS